MNYGVINLSLVHTLKSTLTQSFTDCTEQTAPDGLSGYLAFVGLLVLRCQERLNAMIL